jgi:hypothetical protein
MTKKQLIKRMSAHNQNFDKLWTKIVKDVNLYLQDNPEEKSFSPLQNTQIDKFCDSLSLSGAWVYDRLDGKTSIPHGKDYKGSRTKGTRKVLGYNI